MAVKEFADKLGVKGPLASGTVKVGEQLGEVGAVGPSEPECVAATCPKQKLDGALDMEAVEVVEASAGRQGAGAVGRGGAVRSGQTDGEWGGTRGPIAEREVVPGPDRSRDEPGVDG